MGRIDVILPEELESVFRETVFKRKGMKRGNMTESIEEAIQLWVEENGDARQRTNMKPESRKAK